jgi:microcystin-dependent protein
LGAGVHFDAFDTKVHQEATAVVADTFSSTLGVLLMGTGNDANNWGQFANNQIFQILEDAIANVFTSAATNGIVDLSGTAPPAGPSQARFWQLKFTGSLTGALTVKVPNLTKEWLINTLGATYNGFAISFQTPSGTPLSLPPGWWRVWCDGNNNLNLWPEGYTGIFASAAVVETAGAPYYTFQAEANSGFYRNATQDLRYSVNGVDVFRITGPGSAAGAQLLDILSGTSLSFAGSKIDPTGIVPPGTEIQSVSIFPPSSGWYFEDGSAKSRTTDAPLFNAITATATGNTHSNATIDGLSVDLRGLGLEGAFIEGTGISIGTTIVSINSASSLTLSQATLSTASGVSLRILPFGQGDGSTTFNVPDRRGVVVAGRDNMNGTAKGLLTASTAQGILGTKLNATGGEQAHTDTQAEMPSHTHTATSTVTDPGHNHSSVAGQQNNGGATLSITSDRAENTSTNTTGITVGTTNANTGGGAAHNNIPPMGICNYFIKR